MHNNVLKCKFIVQWPLGQTDLMPENFRRANKSCGSKSEYAYNKFDYDIT